MTTFFTKSILSAITLILLGLTSLVAGAPSLIVLIPAALLVWYRAVPSLRRSRH